MFEPATVQADAALVARGNASASATNALCAPLVFPAIAGRWHWQRRGIRCDLPRGVVHVEASPAALRLVHSLCNGKTRWRVVHDAVAARFGSEGADPFLGGLVRHGVLIEAGSQLAMHAQWGWVPQPCSAPLTTLEALVALRDEMQQPVRQPARGLRLQPARTALSELLAARASAQTFGEEPMSPQGLSDVLWALYGTIGVRDGEVRRTVPSGGGLYAIRWYLALLRDTGSCEAGLYRVQHHAGRDAQGEVSLAAVSGAVTGAWGTLLTPAILSHAQAVVYPVADLASIEKKYGNRALTLAMIEAGHALQNGAIAATLGGGASIVRGDTVETEVQRLFGLDSRAYPLPSLVMGGLASSQQTALARAHARRFPIQNIPGTSRSLNLSTQVCVAGPIPVCEEPVFRLWASGRSSDPRLAAVKAEAEAWERIGWSTPSPEVFMAPMREVTDAVDPRTIVAYADAQYARDDFDYQRWSDARSYPWVAGVDVADGRSVSLMAQCVYALSALAPLHSKRPYTNASTSGAAAWVSTEGAIARAVSELIERDAFARCWLKRGSPPCISSEQIPDAIRHRLEVLSAAGYTGTVQLLESSYLPVVSVFLQCRQRRYTALTTAAAFQFEDALDAALGEAESRVQEYHGRASEAGLSPADVHAAHDHGKFYRSAKNFRRADFYAGANRALSGRELKTQLRKFPRRAAALMDRLQADGLPIYACDITAPGSSILQGRTPLQVWRAFVPGLLPLWFGHGCEPYGLLERQIVSLNLPPAQLRQLVLRPSTIHPCT